MPMLGVPKSLQKTRKQRGLVNSALAFNMNRNYLTASIIFIIILLLYILYINSNNSNSLFIDIDNSENRSQHYIYNYHIKFGRLRPSKNLLTSIIISNDSFENIKNIINPNGTEEYNYDINGVKLSISKSFVYFNGKKFKTEDHWFYIKNHKLYPTLKNANNISTIVDDWESSNTNFTKLLNAKAP